MTGRWTGFDGGLRASVVSAVLLFTRVSPHTAVAQGGPCCGVVTAAGEHLGGLLDSMHVEQLWQARVHVNWETGVQDRPDGYEGHGTATHCSAFAAAVGKRLNVYMLRPPEHPQTLLASAQTAWFHTPEAVKDGWAPVASMQQAQALANRGELVVISFESPDPNRAGHIAVVRPSLKSSTQLAADGPEIIQAGTRNYNDTVARIGFAQHAGAWPNGVRVFAHTVGAGASD